MKKEELVEKLRADVTKTARLEKKAKQLLFIIIPLLVIAVALYILVCFDVILPETFGSSSLAFVMIVLVCGNFLPFGKISEEKINKYFQERLSSKIKDVQEELDGINDRKPKLEEKLKLLNEI